MEVIAPTRHLDKRTIELDPEGCGENVSKRDERCGGDVVPHVVALRRELTRSSSDRGQVLPMSHD